MVRRKQSFLEKGLEHAANTTSLGVGGSGELQRNASSVSTFSNQHQDPFELGPSLFIMASPMVVYIGFWFEFHLRKPHRED